MAISVDTVYKTVLLILNNEQRGYMTPDEFNKIGSQVQRQIFEAYFEDLNQQLRIPQSDVEYSDRVAITDEKIAEFKTESQPTGTNPFTVPTDLYRLGSVTSQQSGRSIAEIQRVGRADYYNLIKSPLTAPSLTHPIYLYENDQLIVSPSSISGKVKVQYVKKPDEIRWGYTIGGVGQYVFTDYNYVATAINIGDITSSISGNFISDATISVDNALYAGGSGTGAEFNVTINASGQAGAITVANQGSGYAVGDVITFSTPQFGPGTVGGPLTITLTSADLFSGSQQGKVDFELHNSERTEVILRILLYSGIVIRDPQIVQVAAQKIQQEEVNEKS
jgi:hypothetical protein